MAEDTPVVPVARFAAYEVDVETGELRKHGMRIKLQDQPFLILIMLLEHPGALVTREQIRQKLWPSDTFVDFDHSVNTAIRRLRDALGDDADNPRFIETLPRRGYRFIADVQWPAVVNCPEPIAAEVPLETDKAAAATPDSVQQSTEFTGKVESARFHVPSRWLWAVAVAVVVVITLTWRLWPRGLSIDSLAVLPFATDSKDDQYLGEGLAQGVTSAVGEVPGLRVASANSALRFAGTSNVRGVAQQLHVAAVLIGRIRRPAIGPMTISVELIDGRDERHLWGAEYSVAAGDMPTVERLITDEVAQRLKRRLRDRDGDAAPVQTRNAVAYQQYLRGRYSMRRRGRSAMGIASVRSAMTFFQQAIDADPNYALAYVGVAEAAGVLAFYGDMEPGRAFGIMKAAATRAGQLAPNLCDAHLQIAHYERAARRNRLLAEQEFRRALQINPNSAEAHHGYAMVLTDMGRFDEAIAETDKAMQLDPGWPGFSGNKAWALYYARRWDEAEKLLLSRTGGTRQLLGYIYAQQHKYDQAIEIFKRISDYGGEPYTENFELGYAYAAAGRRAEAEAILANLLRRRKTSYELPSHIARIYAALGNTDEFLRWLAIGVDEQDSFILRLRLEPELDRFRSDPRFQAIVQRAETPE